MSPVRFTNVSNSGRARFLNVSNSGKVSFYVSTSTTTTTTTGLYLVRVYAKLASAGGGETWQVQYSLNGGSFTNVGTAVSSTTCAFIGEDIAVPNTGTDDVVVRVLGPDLATTYYYTRELNSTVCPAYDAGNITCNGLLANINNNRDIAITISTAVTCA